MQRCSMNSSFCLGMTEFNCCGTDSFVMDSSEEPCSAKEKAIFINKESKKPLPAKAYCTSIICHFRLLCCLYGFTFLLK